MKLAYVEMRGFRGFRDRIRVEFGLEFTVIDGRNGVGKSTIFDAVEFALTGEMAKYGDAKAAGETVSDYVWWSGAVPPLGERYVEVGFVDSHGVLPIRRTPLDEGPPPTLTEAVARLCDASMMPSNPLPQLCAASVLRDEHIAALSVDLKETERYALLREAIGASDADEWISRAEQVLRHAKRRVREAEELAASAAKDMTAAAQHIDEVRSQFAEEVALSAAVQRLQEFAATNAPVDELAEIARGVVGSRVRRMENLQALQEQGSIALEARATLPTLQAEHARAEQDLRGAEADVERLRIAAQSGDRADSLAQAARDLLALVRLGRGLGLQEGKCPLCASEVTQGEFTQGLSRAEQTAGLLNDRATEEADRLRALEAAERAVVARQQALEQSAARLSDAEAAITGFERGLASAELPRDTRVEMLQAEVLELKLALDQAREDLALVETVKLNAALERARHSERKAKQLYQQAEERLARVRQAEGRAKALYDATRRAASETLDRRLDRVLPLMTELYRRLRPHPIWEDIDYRIRGDVRRFLTLRVGDGLNPQFIFSSGQRRATGLAFLLSINLSLAWSRWRTVLLDDPVQHVDDFRSVHLAEVMAQLVSSGRQVICAVEDPALADLLGRRMPIKERGAARRVTLGLSASGAMTTLRDEQLKPLPLRTLVPDPRQAAG